MATADEKKFCCQCGGKLDDNGTCSHVPACPYHGKKPACCPNCWNEQDGDGRCTEEVCPCKGKTSAQCVDK